MSKQALRETLAFLGVVGSLLFVGLEIRQNNAIARAQTRQALTSEYREFWTALAYDENLAEIQGPALAGSDSRASIVQWVRMRLLENVYHQYKEGVIDESVFLGYGWAGDPEFKTGEFGAWWQERRERFDPGFVKEFERRQGIAHFD
ncbi:MAG TPA: hypothetical protein VLA43_02250 [Longimicrobiales bacterium]|nr:hypothetical protein [Longimicrobiales bacterium]